MPFGMKAELRGVPPEMAEIVGAHLMAAGQLIDSDPELAYRHAEAARRRAARLPITREACAETAYAAGMYEEALSQYKALRRMTGTADVVPVMVDCLRALGRYRDAMELAEASRGEITDPAMRVELVIVTAGVRIDMGQPEEGMRLLRTEIERPGGKQPRLARARLLYAFADHLAEAGDLANARRGFAMAARLDPDGTTAALDRLDEFDGVVLELDESEFTDDEIIEGLVDEDEAEQPEADETGEADVDQDSLDADLDDYEFNQAEAEFADYDGVESAEDATDGRSDQARADQ